MKRENLVGILCVLCMIAGSQMWIGALVMGESSEAAMEQYWQDINIDIQRIKIKSYDGVELAALVIQSTPIQVVPNGSRPVVVHMNGINSQKEDHFDYTINLAKLGFLGVVVECRGHGESGGRVSLYGQEPGDIPEVIDYIDVHYPDANTTHVAVSGFSYGAGNMLRAQVLDERIYCAALFHPLSDLHSFLQDYQLPALVGTRWFMPIQYGNYTGDKIVGREALTWVTPENTANLLLIQGTGDDTVYPEDTKKIYDVLNGDSRADIQIVYRLGLGHGENERNPISQKYAMAWLKYYFWNQSINRDNLDLEINYIERFEYTPPSIENVSNLIWGGVILCIIGIWIVFRLGPKTDMEDTAPFIEAQSSNTPCEKVTDQRLIRYIIALLGASLVSGIASMIINPNLIWSIVIIIPLVSAGFFLILLPNITIYIRKAVQRPTIEKSLRFFLESLFFIGPLLIGCAIYDRIMIETWQRPIWPWIPMTFVALIVLPLVLTAIYLPFRIILDQFPKASKWKGLLLLPIWIISMYIYTIFVPMPPIVAVPFSVWLIPAIFGLLFFLLGPIFRIIHALWGKILPIFLLIALIACFFCWIRPIIS